MSFITDDDRNAHRTYVKAQAVEEAKIAKEARTLLIQSFEKTAEILMDQARASIEVSGVVKSVAINDDYSTTICAPHHYAALKIHQNEPGLLVRTLNKAFGITEGREYRIARDDKYDWHSIRIASECCGWSDGLKIGVRIDFTPPLR